MEQPIVLSVQFQSGKPDLFVGDAFRIQATHVVDPSNTLVISPTSVTLVLIKADGSKWTLSPVVNDGNGNFHYDYQSSPSDPPGTWGTFFTFVNGSYDVELEGEVALNSWETLVESLIGSGFTVIAGNPTSPFQGQAWLNTETNQLLYFDGTNTDVLGVVIVATSEPSYGSLGWLWFNPNGPALYIYTSSGWQSVAGTGIQEVTAGDSSLTITTTDNDVTAEVASAGITPAKVATSLVDQSTLQGGAGTALSIKSVGPSQLGSVTDGVTTDQNGAGSKIEAIGLKSSSILYIGASGGSAAFQKFGSGSGKRIAPETVTTLSSGGGPGGDGCDFGSNSPLNNTGPGLSQSEGAAECFLAVGNQGAVFVANQITSQVPFYLGASSSTTVNGLVIVGTDVNTGGSGSSFQLGTGLPFLMAFANPGANNANLVIEELGFTDNGISPSLPSNLTSTSSGNSQGGTTITVTTTPTGWIVGQKFTIGSGSAMEYSTVAAITGDTITTSNALLNNENSKTLRALDVLCNFDSSEHSATCHFSHVKFNGSHSGGSALWNFFWDVTGLDDSVFVNFNSGDYGRILATQNDASYWTGGFLGGFCISFQEWTFSNLTIGNGPSSAYEGGGTIDLNTNMNASWGTLNFFGCYFDSANANVYFTNNGTTDCYVNIYGGHVSTLGPPSSSSWFGAPPTNHMWHVTLHDSVHANWNSASYIFASSDTSSILKIRGEIISTSGSPTFPSFGQVVWSTIKSWVDYPNATTSATSFTTIGNTYTFLGSVVGITGSVKARVYWRSTGASSNTNSFALYFGGTQVAIVTDSGSTTNQHILEIEIWFEGASNSAVITWRDFNLGPGGSSTSIVSPNTQAGHNTSSTQFSNSQSVVFQGMSSAGTGAVRILNTRFEIMSSSDSTL